MTQSIDGAQEESRTHQEDKRERELCNDQQFASSPLAARCGGGYALKAALNIAAHGTERRKHAGDNRRGERERREANHHPPIHMNGAAERQLPMDLPPQQLDGCLRKNSRRTRRCS